MTVEFDIEVTASLDSLLGYVLRVRDTLLFGLLFFAGFQLLLEFFSKGCQLVLKIFSESRQLIPRLFLAHDGLSLCLLFVGGHQYLRLIAPLEMLPESIDQIGTIPSSEGLIRGEIFPGNLATSTRTAAEHQMRVAVEVREHARCHKRIWHPLNGRRLNFFNFFKLKMGWHLLVCIRELKIYCRCFQLRVSVSIEGLRIIRLDIPFGAFVD
ncbi:unnamed protein product [Clonostachys chloroleuca]|uniref:Uncharacterized protein n=1 Tax=Clonostachys chloroleuca TaxID=1926264 RepID=A0AA35MDX6_9HYPO|nr:unnamed protein product [Clonostachys chloroleuca]